MVLGGGMNVVVNVGKRVDGRRHHTLIKPLKTQLNLAGLANLTESAEHGAGLQVVRILDWIPNKGTYNTREDAIRSISPFSYQRKYSQALPVPNLPIRPVDEHTFFPSHLVPSMS
jgi:hypothetical protein